MNQPTPQADRSAPADRGGDPATLRWAAVICLAASSIATHAQDTPGAVTTNVMANVEAQKWNWHIQNTDIVQGDPGFPAKYSGPNSLGSGGEIRETVSWISPLLFRLLGPEYLAGKPESPCTISVF